MKNKLIQKYSLLVCGMCIAFIVGNTQAMEQPINEEEVLSTPYDYAKFTQALEEANQIIQESNGEVIHDINRLNKFWTLEIYYYIIWETPKNVMTTEQRAATKALWDGIRDCLDRFKNPICVQELLEEAKNAVKIRWTDAGVVLSQEQVNELITKLTDTSRKLFLQQRTPTTWTYQREKNPGYNETLCLDLAAWLKHAPTEVTEPDQNASEAMKLTDILINSIPMFSEYSPQNKSTLILMMSSIWRSEELWKEKENYHGNAWSKIVIKKFYETDSDKTVELINHVSKYNPRFAEFLTLCTQNTWKFLNINYVSAN